MFSIIDRYLVGEMLRALLAVASILFLATVGVYVAETMGDVAKGRIPTEVLGSQIALRSLEALSIILPLSLFLGIMVALGRLYRDNEMSVLQACGVGTGSLVRAVAYIGAPAFVALMLLSVWLSPWAVRKSEELLFEASKRVSVAGLTEGRFNELGPRRAVLYVQSLLDKGRQFENVFMHSERGPRKDVLVAERGFQYQDPQTGERFVALINGHRTEGVPGQRDYRMMRFHRNDIKLPDPAESEVRAELESAPIAELLASDSPIAKTEIHWRLTPPFAALVLMILALPMSRTSPREGRYGKLVIGILAYFSYANVLSVGKHMLEDGDLPLVFGLWWVHLLVLIPALWLLLRNPLRRRRRRRRSAKETA
ncbi:MAG: LPS export ABC transporter permease LptF [Lysobacteraceae bacterium]|nr:MAG: LPS export ABC transporter permease LptF [Xanthomonadaceae bacterium]